MLDTSAIAAPIGTAATSFGFSNCDDLDSNGTDIIVNGYSSEQFEVEMVGQLEWLLRHRENSCVRAFNILNSGMARMFRHAFGFP